MHNWPSKKATTDTAAHNTLVGFIYKYTCDETLKVDVNVAALLEMLGLTDDWLLVVGAQEHGPDTKTTFTFTRRRKGNENTAN